MSLYAEWAPYRLNFKFLARTSRSAMTVKDTYFVKITDSDTGKSAIGECALFKGLSSDDRPDYEQRLSEACHNPLHESPYSSIRFGFECALQQLEMHNPNDFEKGHCGIPINGLIWMGDKAEMSRRIDAKLADGYRVLKLKIGGIDFSEELELLKYIRSRYNADTLELRLDANGSFTADNALEKLEQLNAYGIHSLEQPIKAKQWDAMAHICKSSPIPIALDEELIGVPTQEYANQLLDYIKPQYIILKPALCGGPKAASMWADTATSKGIGWWATSALESNIGLAAIGRWISGYRYSMPQGLGTGQLYHNNIESPLYINEGKLFYDPNRQWIIPKLEWRR